MVKNLNTIDRGTKIRLGRWHNDDQADNTIVINASDTPINASNANALYMKPIRSDPSNNTLMTGFDPNTYEIVNTGLRRDDVAPREVDYYANIGNTFTSTIKFEGDTSLTTEGVVGIGNIEPIHTLDVGTKFYVDENGANVLTVLGDTYVQDDVVIGGNLDVRGTLTSINTENTTIKDAIIELGKGNTSSDIGIIMDRPDTNVVMGYRDTVDEFVIAHTTSSSTSSTITPSSELIDARIHGRLHVNANLTVDTDTLHVDAIRDRVGINTLNPQTDLDVVGSAHVHSDFAVDTDTLFVDASTDRVGINTLTPSTDFHVEGETYVSGNVTVDTDTFHVDTVNDRVGINTLNPTTDFHVEGDTYVSGNVDVQTNLNVLTDAVVTGNVDVQTDLNVIGNVYATSNIVTTGNVDVQTNLNVATDAIVTGNVDVQTDLNVVGNAYVSSNAVVTGNVDVQSELNVLGNAEIQTDLTVVGNAYVSSNAIVTGNVDVQTDLNVVGNAYVSSNAIVTGNVDVQTDLNVVGNAYLTSNVIITGNADVQTDLNVVGNAYLTSNAIVSGNVDVQTNLNVATDAIVTGNVDVQTDLNVVGNTYLSSNAIVTGNVDVQTNLNVATDAIVTGNVDVQTDLNVVGNTYLSSNAIVTGNVDVQTNLNVATDAIVTGNVDVQTDLNVVGNAYITSNAVVTGNVDVQQNLNVVTDAIVTGNVDVQTDLNVVGDVYASSNIVATGNVDVQQNLNVVTDAIVTGNVDVQTDLNVAGNAYLSSNAIVTGNVDVQSDLNVAGGAYVTTYYGDGGLLSNVNLQVVSDHGNTTSSTVQFTNATTGLVTTSNVEVGDRISIGNLSVDKIPIVGTGNFLENSTIGRSNGTIVISSDLEVLGDIIVDGNSYTVESNNLVISDRIIGIANNNVSHELDVGIIMEHPGKNIALIHHGEAQGEEDPHDHTFTIGYTQNTLTDNHIFDDSNLITVEILGNLITQNNLTVSENITVVGTTTLQDSVGIANTAPIHDLDVGSNLYVDDTGSNVLHVTGNVYATRFVGDGSFLENIASSFQEITNNGNVTTNTVQFDGSTALVTTGKVGISNTAPIHDLDVGSNLYVDDQGSNVLHVTGNVYATRFVGDGAFLENIASNLHEITTNGNVTTNTVQFDGSTALVTTGGVGIANTAPIHDLDVGSNLYIEDTGSNVVHVTGNVYATRFVGDGAFLENIASNLHEITTNGNVTTNTVHFDGSTALVTTGNVGIANAAPDHELSVTGNVYISSEVNVVGGLVTNLGGLTKKTYGYSAGTITASTTPEINVVFDSQLFSAKITAHLVEPTSNISVLNLDVTGGTGRNIGKGFLNIIGDQNSKHWDSTINTTDTTVTLTPSVGLLSDGTYGVHVEYTSPLGTGGVTSIDKNNTNEITFDY
jgi:carbonic anhydrase/acetyltransferase-like protein (isoleucine patch superfamily)